MSSCLAVRFEGNYPNTSIDLALATVVHYGLRSLRVFTSRPLWTALAMSVHMVLTRTLLVVGEMTVDS